MKYIVSLLFLLLLICPFSLLFAQKKNQPAKQEQCATMDRLAIRLARDPALNARFTQGLEVFNSKVKRRLALRQQGIDSIAGTNDVTYTIPIVFHIVLTNPAAVTDAQITAQLKILNEDFAGTDPDSVGIPAYFKPLHGKSNIQFCLAQRTPTGDVTSGIERITTTKTSFSATDDGVKHVATGGADMWDGDKYYNVWVCVLSNNILGYATFPDDGETTEQGVAVDYRSLPGGPYANFSGGKTLTHETGHYFNLFHIWGDDDGACTGTDYIDDTPNQANSTTGCYSGIKTDSCTTGGDGILYQDYMDYSYDQCLLLFTPDQDVRMESALLTYRASLLTSNGCIPPVLQNLDAQLKSITAPAQRICTNSFSPVVAIKNRGALTLTSVLVSVVVDNGPAVSQSWSGSLVSQDTISIHLNSLTVSQGVHTLQFFVSSPNASTDQDKTNDTLTTTVQYYAPVQTMSESFEGSTFPPAGWDIINPDEYITWKKVTGVAKTGNASVMINNHDYSTAGQQDYLRLPQINVAGVDSAFFTFQLAASTYSPVSTPNNTWDTLEVLLSKDCGVTYSSLYKKWGANLVTTAAADTGFFIPSASEWRRDSINLTPYINSGNFMLAFRNTTEYENNIYLDDVNLRTLIINPNLKVAGFLITPNPAHTTVSVQFYPNPANLRGIGLYNMLGQKLAEIDVSSGQAGTLYNFDVSRYPVGMYVVRAAFTDKVLVKKFIKG